MRESAIKERIGGAKITSQVVMRGQRLHRQRFFLSKHNKNHIVVDVPEILPCDSSDAESSSSTLTALTLTPLDFSGEALHKRYYTESQDEEATPTAATTSQSRRSQNQYLNSSLGGVHPQKELMKRHRRDRTATFGMVGAGIGTLILPVIGTVVGGMLVGYATNQSLKRHEKKIERKWERNQFQRNASASPAAMNAVFV